MSIQGFGNVLNDRGIMLRLPAKGTDFSELTLTVGSTGPPIQCRKETRS